MGKLKSKERRAWVFIPGHRLFSLRHCVNKRYIFLIYIMLLILACHQQQHNKNTADARIYTVIQILGKRTKL